MALHQQESFCRAECFLLSASLGMTLEGEMTVPVLLGYTAWLLQQTPHLMCSLVRMLELTKEEDFR